MTYCMTLNSIIAPFFYTRLVGGRVISSAESDPTISVACRWFMVNFGDSNGKPRFAAFFPPNLWPQDFGCDFTGAKHNLRYLRWSWIQNVKNTTPRLGTFGILAADAVCNTLKFIYECLGRLGNEFSHYWWPCGFCCVLVDFLEITKTTSENQNPWRVEPCWTYFSSTYTLTCQT